MSDYIYNSVLPFIYNHQYNLKLLRQSDIDFVTNNLTSCLSMTDIPFHDLDINMVLKFPGFLYFDPDLIKQYFRTIYSPYFMRSVTPPRGLVDTGSVIIVGISPGNSSWSIGESNWLYGPSSKNLHKLISFTKYWYFTNVCKQPFDGNIVDEDIIMKWYPSIIEELRFFKNQKVIFLGSYDIYDTIIKELKLKKYLKTYHPAYFNRHPYRFVEKTSKQIKRFCSE